MIRARRLTKSWQGRRVVDGVSFDVPEGLVTGLVGPNGAGKTTTLKMLLALVRPDSGSATVDGVPYAELGRAATVVGSALDGAEPLGSSSPQRFLTLLARGQGIPGARVSEVVEAMGLTAVARQPVRRFSLGMRKRVGLAAALLGRPRYLVVDEPTNGMDPPSIVWLREELRAQARQGTGVLVASHLLDEQERTCDRLVVLAAGEVVASGPLAEVVSRHGARRLEVRVPVAEVARLRDRAARSGCELTPTDQPGQLVGQAAALGVLGEIFSDGGFHPQGLQVLDGGLATAFARLTDHRQQHALSTTAPGRPVPGRDLVGGGAR